LGRRGSLIVITFTTGAVGSTGCGLVAALGDYQGSSALSDAAVDAPDSGGGPHTDSDAGGDDASASSSFVCGSGLCAVGSFCCYGDYSDAASAACSNDVTCPSGYLFACDDDLECVAAGYGSDAICCADKSGTDIIDSNCVKANPQGCGTIQIPLCDLSLGARACPGTENCQAADEPQGYAYCAAP
jgi:hypothetical protein